MTMPFLIEPRLKGNEYFERKFGEYVCTFVSEHGQVRAALFRRGDQLEVHATIMGGLNPGEVTDRFVTDIREYAREHGYEGRLKMIYSESMEPIQDATAPR
ncbi:MAG TPA: hypothetical protein VG406_23370 [Isosphaeraceae bacterium]|nr:hypothetical protein [Isosphaeraceae bacterium]